MKLRKLYYGYGEDKEVKGYELNGYYLMKHSEWGNSYSWIINRTGDTFYYHNEFWKAVEDGEVIMVRNFKQGKEKLVELANGNQAL